jgi:hypothetical protein
MLNMTKASANQNVGVSEALYAVESTPIPHKKNSMGKTNGKNIELRFHMIGELIDLCFFYHVGYKKSCCLCI